MPIKKVLGPNILTGQKVPVKIWTNDVANNAMDQLEYTAMLPFVHKHVAAMPDVHYGLGATIGSVIPTVKALIPAAVGVDIGCGMNALRLDIKSHQLPDNLKPMRMAIEAVIPLGAGKGHSFKTEGEKDKWMDRQLLERLTHIHYLNPGIINNPHKKAIPQMGTLGSGNHFVEICIDEEDYVWIMLHSGSRGIGNRIGTYFIDRAKEQMEQWHINLPDPNLAYLPEGTKLFSEYVDAVQWAQDYALENRAMMMSAVLYALQEFLPDFNIKEEAINCHHNYVEKENHYGKNVYITRKGAIRARKGELGIIPGSMGDKSYIVRGLGNDESFCSCSHGAGRIMSRTQAKKLFTVEHLKGQTKGVECRKDADVLDEIPGAYKRIEEVMENQSDLVSIVHTLKQVINIKG